MGSGQCRKEGSSLVQTIRLKNELLMTVYPNLSLWAGARGTYVDIISISGSPVTDFVGQRYVLSINWVMWVPSSIHHLSGRWW